jgi:hypothetical protein
MVDKKVIDKVFKKLSKMPRKEFKKKLKKHKNGDVAKLLIHAWGESCECGHGLIHHPWNGKCTHSFCTCKKFKE